MMKTTMILSAWVSLDDMNMPEIMQDHTLLGIVDRTGQQTILPEPNLCVFDICCDDATALLIAADANYSVLTTNELGLPAFLDVPTGEDAPHWQDVLRNWEADNAE